MTQGHVILTKPPDGGYGWVITFSAFITSLILDGISFSFGIFYKEFLVYFNESAAKTALIGSVYNGTYLMSGPIVSILCNKFGCRIVAMIGGVLACISCILAMLCNSVDMLILTYGFMGGFSFGMMYLPSLVMVGYYFESKRALATGIAVCGTGVGAFVFSKMSEYLIAEFGWRGATLIIAGTAFNGTVTGALLRPLEARVLLNTCSNDSSSEQIQNSELDFADVNCQKNTIEIETVTLTNGTNSVETDEKLLESKETRPNRYKKKKDAAMNKSSQNTFRSLQNFLNGPQSEQDEKIDICFTSTYKLDGPKVRIVDVSRPEMRKDTFFMGSTDVLTRSSKNIPSSLYPTVIEKNNVHQSVLELVTDATAVEKIISSEKDDFKKVVIEYLKNSLDGIKLLIDNPSFAIYGISCIACMLGFYVPFTYLPNYVDELHLGNGCDATLLQVIAGSNLISRVLVGILGDRKWVDCLVLNMIALIVGGVFTLFFHYYRTMIMLWIACIAFGTSIAVFVALRSIITVQFIGVEKLSAGVGYILMCQGISSFIGTPIAGAIADGTGKLSSVFYYAGAALLLSGFLCVIMKILSKSTKSSDQTKT